MLRHSRLFLRAVMTTPRAVLADEPETVANADRYAEASSTGLSGPDQILPTKADRTWDRDGRVRIKLNPQEDQSELLSIPGLFKRIATKYPNRSALVPRPGRDGFRRAISWKQYANQVKTVAKAFLRLGLRRHHSVCILGFNSPEWFIAYLAAIHAGGIAVGIYNSNSPEACQYCAESSRANIIVVGDNKQMEKIMKIKDNLPDLKYIIQYDGVPSVQDYYILSWRSLLDKGVQETEDQLESVLKTLAINECCSLVYTSGTTGNPKAVMLSHDNLLSNARAILKGLNVTREAQDVVVSYLPLSHVAAQVLDIITCMLMAGTVYFADSDALRGSLLETLVVARPTFFTSVPRVWEKLYEKMHAVWRNTSPFNMRIANWARDQALRYHTDRMSGVDERSWSYTFAKHMVLGKFKAALGLDRSVVLTTAAAPLSLKVKRYFMSFDMMILDCYGMSESGGAHSVTPMNKFNLNGVGITLPGFATKLINEENYEGEICMSGRHIFMGYLNEPEKTKEAKDEDCWLHTGDIGTMTEDGYLYITGRIKELIITAGGENIPPARIEEFVKQECPAISNCMVVGERRKFLAILITLKTEVDPETGVPKDKLSKEALDWVRSMGSEATTVKEALVFEELAKISRGIKDALYRANAKAINNAQRVQKFQILPRDFSVATGELGPTLKLKRSVVEEKYHGLIDNIYKEILVD